RPSGASSRTRSSRSSAGAGASPSPRRASSAPIGPIRSTTTRRSPSWRGRGWVAARSAGARGSRRPWGRARPAGGRALRAWRRRASESLVYWPALVSAKHVQQHVFVGGEETVVASVAEAPAIEITTPPASPPRAFAGATVRLPFGRLFGTRSGDKGGNANLGV